MPISAARAHGLIGAFRAPLSSGVSLRVALRVALRLALPLRARLEGALSELFLCERLEPALRARLHLGRRKLERLRRCERPRPRAWLLVEDLGLPLSLLLALPARRRLPLHVLADARDASEGLITEAFAMDHVGLNVAVSDPTSDYWQGDEAKWRQTYKVGADAIHISDVELDESTQTYQSQVSLPVVDPDGGAPIGAVTFGINVELLQ